MCSPTSSFSSCAFIPQDAMCEVLSLLPTKQLLEFKTTCHEYKDLIENSPRFQVRIAELYLIKNQLHANIPLGNLKHFVNNTNLTVEIKGDTNVFHLTHDLTPIIPWIKELIIKNCGASRLADLIHLLKNSKQLSTLSLYECKLNETCIASLQDLAKNPIHQIELKLCSCDIEYDPLPNELSGIKLIPETDAYQFNIENIETGTDGLEEFEQQVSNEIAPPKDVVEAFDLIKNTLRAGVIRTIWHTMLMNPKEQCKPLDYIANEVRLYIEGHPHHPAVISAATTIKTMYLSKNYTFS